jgi:hypothetical protein
MRHCERKLSLPSWRGLTRPSTTLSPKKQEKTWITGHRRAEATPFFRTAMPGDDGWIELVVATG